MKKRVLITGATGFVGYHLIKSALANNLEVYANVRHSANATHLKDFPINYVDLDLSSIYLLKENIEDKKYDYIVHAAAVTKAKKLDDYNQVNAIYTRNLAVAASKATHLIKKFVFISSLAALGPLNQKSERLTDKSASHPVTNYGISKALAETYLAQVPNLPLIVFRPTAVYGPREKDIFILIKTIKAGLELYIGKQEQDLSFVYATDLANIIVNALASDVVGKSYNISDGAVYSRSSLANYVSKALGKKTLTVNVPVPLIKGLAWSMERVYSIFNKIPALNVDKIKELTALNWGCDIKNIQRDFGFTPQFGLEQGINETINWYRKNNWL
ncbi:UDP-glucose 4-epimerase [Pedobacter sp. Leaf216]|uniref:NAD-dependent epimerase/dehydratase family protein n=1 Tax=Pedobacter sp. Leaf216 TaxID=1735684 RepID=UPI0006FE06C1|nr:NAD(P)-dependent oxidoreductase [Pedobacter sp. Leaf216]KQM76338.1 UDP-glucose 4-epimerase [Pedobacter sp. Leaf216]